LLEMGGHMAGQALASAAAAERKTCGRHFSAFIILSQPELHLLW